MSWYRKQGYEGPSILEWYFKKKKQNGILGFLYKFNKRWFVLDFDKSTLSYSANKNKKTLSIINFKDIVEVISSHSVEKLRMAIDDKELEELK